MRSRKTREQRIQEIRVAAKKVFLEKGYRNTTMEDIIAETELSKGGFYYYYSSTKEIMIDIIKTLNVLYLKYNPYLAKMNDILTIDQKKEILVDSILTKIFEKNDDKIIYSMFGCELIYDKDMYNAYIEVEKKAIEILCERMSIDMSDNYDTLMFISRAISGYLLTNNIFKQSYILENEREELRIFFKKYIDRLIR